MNIVSVHNSDPMQSDNASSVAYDQLISGKISGFPSMVIDRREVSDPSNCFTDYANEGAYYGYADMGIKAKTTTGKVIASVKVKPASDMTGDYRIELIVEEDGPSGAAGSTWDQHNYYSGGGSGAMQTIGYNFATLPNPVTGVKFPFVGRATVPANVNTTPNGVAGSLPGTMTSGTTYTWTDSSVVIASNWVASKLRVIALLIDNTTGNTTKGQILNSISSPGLYTGVQDETMVIGNMNVFPNPTNDMAHIRFELTEATTVNFSVIDVMGRVVFSAPAEQMNAGNQQINISTADYAAGVYNVVIRTDKGQVSQHLSVIR